MSQNFVKSSQCTNILFTTQTFIARLAQWLYSFVVVQQLVGSNLALAFFILTRLVNSGQTRTGTLETLDTLEVWNPANQRVQCARRL